MPIPAIILAVEAVAAAINVAASAYTAWLAAGVIDQYKREILAATESALTLNMGPLATEFANDRLKAAGLGIEFSDITNATAVQEEVDAHVTERVNTKAGTKFTSIKGLTRDQFLAEAGSVLADRVKADIGVDVELWPPAALKDSISAAVLEQVKTQAAGLIPSDLLAAIDEAVLSRLGLNKDSDGSYIDPEKKRKLAQNAARQKKYRESNKMHCRC